MFEDVDKPIEPVKPPEGKQPSQKDWGPFQPVSRSEPPKTPLPNIPPTHSGYPENLGAPGIFDQEPKPSRKKFIIIGIVIIVVIGILIAGALLVLYNLNKLTNANSNQLVNANINENQNINLNENQNANLINNTQNVNANVNVNANTNTNINTNVNTNVNVNAAQNTNTVTVIDSDNDGLEDKYETTFGTSANNTDSDNDSFNDLAEIKNRYNPAGPGKMTSLTFNSFCQKFVEKFVEESEFTDTEIANTCEVATEVFNLTDSLKSKIDTTAEQKMKNGCQVLDKKSESCEKVIWLIALTFQDFDNK